MNEHPKPAALTGMAGFFVYKGLTLRFAICFTKILIALTLKHLPENKVNTHKYKLHST